MKQDLKKLNAWQHRSAKKSQQNQHKRNVEKLKDGTLKKRGSYKVNVDRTKPELLVIADRWFNKFIRLRDGDKCISCGKKGGQIQAGHFVPKSRGEIIRYDERNVSSQCLRCNYFLSGNLGNYRVALDKKFGKGTVDKLEQKANTSKPYSREKLRDLIKKYKNKIEEL